MFERYTDRARRVLVLAQGEAGMFSHGEIGTGHLLLGLIAEEDGIAAKALESLGVSRLAARLQVEALVEPVAIAPAGSPAFTPRVKAVFELSLREALELGHSYIGTEHLLLGLVREGEGVGAQALQNLGIDLLRVRGQVIGLLSGYKGKGSAESSTGPKCTGCQAELAEVARYRSIGIPPTTLSPLPMSAEVVFCNECGHVFAIFKEEPTKPA